MLIVGINLSTSYFFKNEGFLVLPESNGMIANGPSYTFYFQFPLTLAFCSKINDETIFHIERNISTLGCFLLSILLMFIDEHLEGISQTKLCPLLIMQIVFVFLCQQLRNFFSLTIRSLWPDTR